VILAEHACRVREFELRATGAPIDAMERGESLAKRPEGVQDDVSGYARPRCSAAATWADASIAGKLTSTWIPNARSISF
jgi:hypothetical protein